MIPVILQKLKGSKTLKRRSIFTFDCETKDGLLGKEIFCWSLCKMNEKSDFDIVTGFDHNFEPLLNAMPKKGSKTNTTIIYVHNLSFDVRFLIEYLALHKIKHRPLLSGSNFISLDIPDYHCRFVDSFQFLFSSQEKAEEEWLLEESAFLKDLYNELEGHWFEEYFFYFQEYLPKLRQYAKYTKIDCSDLFNESHPHYKPFKQWSWSDMQRVIEHNKNDVIALLLIMKKFRQTMWDIGHIDVLTCYSTASLAMKIFRVQMTDIIINPFLYFDKHEKCYKEKHNGKWEQFVRESYFGGRCEVFDMNIHYNAIYIDRVSMYPAEMFSQKYPNDIPYESQDIDELMACITQDNGIEGFIHAKIMPNQTLHYPILPQKLDHKIMFTNCEREGTYTIPELRYAYSLGYQIEPIKGLLYKHSDKIFESYIEKLFAIKKKEKGGRKNGAKILMNSLYGKFGQAFHKKNVIMHYHFSSQEQLDFLRQAEIDGIKIVKHLYSAEQNIYIAIELNESHTYKAYMNVAIASYVTSYARIALHKKMMEFESNGIEILYCDTDSLTIEQKDLSQIKLGKNLGDWDIEQTFDSVKFMAPKCYISMQKGKPKLKMKGIPRQKIDEICKSSKSIQDIEQQIVEPIALAERYMCYTESHRTGIILNTKFLTKHYSFENQKREFIEGKSYPWTDYTLPDKLKYGKIMTINRDVYKVNLTGKIAKTQKQKEALYQRVLSFLEFQCDINIQEIDVDSYIDYRLADDEIVDRILCDLKTQVNSYY